MKDDKKMLLDSKIIKRKKKKIIRLKNNKIFKKLQKKRTLNLYMKRILIFIIIMIIIIFILYLLMIKKKSKKKWKLENISYILNYSLKYEEFDENINEQYIQLQNSFCEKQNESLIQEYENKIIKTDAIYYGKQFEMFVYKGMILLVK